MTNRGSTELVDTTARAREQIELRFTPYMRLVKPALDRVIAALLLLLLAPLLLLVALVVRVTLGSGVLYRQERIGLEGEPFQMLKFRTMQHDRRRSRDGRARTDRRSGLDRRSGFDRRQEQIAFEGPDRRLGGDRRQGERREVDGRRRTHKTDADPRHTRIGRFLRATSIDELPQLLNVVRGDLSLVGPRPELPEVVATYDAWQHARHQVRPGITGLWQVTRRADGTPMHEHVEIDLAYLRRVSLGLDLLLLVGTPLAMLGGRAPFPVRRRSGEEVGVAVAEPRSFGGS